MLQMWIVQQLFWVDVDWRLALAFATQAPFWVDEPPKFWTCKQQKRRSARISVSKLWHGIA